MAGERIQVKAADKRRGGNLPARLRFTARRGVTLIELMIAMLILALVCVSWLEIIGIQSARKEARRREAVERLAGMMDAFVYDPVLLAGGIVKKSGKGVVSGFNVGDYYLSITNKTISFRKQSVSGVVHPVFEDDVSPIGYRLQVLQTTSLEHKSEFGRNWKKNAVASSDTSYWLVGELYDHHGKQEGDWRPFFTLPLYLGQ